MTCASGPMTALDPMTAPFDCAVRLPLSSGLGQTKSGVIVIGSGVNVLSLQVVLFRLGCTSPTGNRVGGPCVRELRVGSAVKKWHSAECLTTTFMATTSKVGSINHGIARSVSVTAGVHLIAGNGPATERG